MYIDFQEVAVYLIMCGLSWAVFYVIARIDTWIGDRKYNRVKR